MDKKGITITGRTPSKPERMIFDTEGFITEAMKDHLTPIATLDKERMIIGVDYGRLEEAVIAYYSQTPEGKLVLEKLIVGSQDVGIDSMGLIDIKSHPLPDKVPYPCHPYAEEDKRTHDQFGNYRYDFGRNEHSRSPRKRK